MSMSAAAAASAEEEALENNAMVLSVDEEEEDHEIDVENNFKLKFCIAHWPDDEEQEEAEIKRRKKLKEGKLCTPSLSEALPLAYLDLSINALSHPPTLDYPTLEMNEEISPIPAGGGRRGPAGEFRAWFPLQAPAIPRKKDYNLANIDRLKDEADAVASGLAGRSAGKPPLPGAEGLDQALAPPPPWVPVPSSAYNYASGTALLLKAASSANDDDMMAEESDRGEDKEVTNAWEERAKDMKPGGRKDIRRFLARIREDNKPSGSYKVADDSDEEIVEFEEDQERYEPLLGHSVRIKDPSDVYNIASEDPGVPMKSYPLISSRFQLGEFAGFVKEEERKEEDDCFVLLDSNLEPEDYVYGQEHSDSDSDSDAEERAPALRRTLKPRKHPAVSDPAVTIFKKKHVTFVPNSYGAMQLGLFWRYNPRLPPAKLPEKECREIADLIMLEMVSGLIASIGVSEHKDATDAPFSVQEWQGEADGGLMATMQSQQLMQMQLMQQMQRMQLAQLRAVEEANNRPPPVIEQIVPVVEEKVETPRPSTAERKRIEEEERFLASFVSAFDWYEGERFPINYLTPPDVCVLFETMGWQKCAGKILESPVDGATLAIMSDEDFALLGLELPSQRRKLIQEVKLFNELGAPQASLVNPQALDVYTAAAETLTLNRMEAMQNGLNVQAPAFDGQALLDMMATMGAHDVPPPNNNEVATSGSPPQSPLKDEGVPELVFQESMSMSRDFDNVPEKPLVDDANFRPSSEQRPRTAEPSEEYLMALAESLDNLPKLFVASGKPGKTHKVRKGVDLSSEEINQLTAGDEVVVTEVGSTMNSLGEEVDRFLLSAPVMGWVSAANFKFEMDTKKQTPKYLKKIEAKMSSKDKKAKKAMEAAAKKKAKQEAEAAKKLAKQEELEAKAEEKRKKELAKAAKKNKNKKKEPEPAPIIEKEECLGKWIAKGEKAQKIENKVRMNPELDSKIVGKVLSGQEINVIGQTTVTKPDGCEVRRLHMNQPKAGWVTAHNFEQLGDKKDKKDNDTANE